MSVEAVGVVGGGIMGAGMGMVKGCAPPMGPLALADLIGLYSYAT